MTINKLATEVARQHTGSRFICTPAPTDTDDDWLILVRDMTGEAENLYATGFYEGGSGNNIDGSRSYKKRLEAGYDLNLILTDKHDFFEKWCAATALAKSLNVLNKDKRIELFNTVLRGRVYHHYLREVRNLPQVQFPIADPVPQLETLPADALAPPPPRPAHEAFGYRAWADHAWDRAPATAAREEAPPPEVPAEDAFDNHYRRILDEVNALAQRPMPRYQDPGPPPAAPNAGFDWRAMARRAGPARFR